MRSVQMVRAALLGVVGTCAAAMSTEAVAAPPSGSCGITGTAAAPGTLSYDPFSASLQQVFNIPLTLTRYADGSKKTQQVNFVFIQPPGSPAYQILYNGTNVLYTEGNTGVHPTINSQDPGEINVNFGGTTQPDSITLPGTFSIIVPPNVDLNAGDPITFDILYVCKGTGGLQDVDTRTRLDDVITVQVNVLSALQASFVGTALDFGEIGDIDNVAAPTVDTGNSNYVRVQSSGAYTVSLASENAFRLRHPTGSLSTPAETVRYNLDFLGRNLNYTNTPTPNAVAFTQNCARAGVPASEADLLYLTATLEEGGQGKTPSLGGQYRDTLTVTITPQNIGVTYPTSCPAL